MLCETTSDNDLDGARRRGRWGHPASMERQGWPKTSSREPSLQIIYTNYFLKKTITTNDYTNQGFLFEEARAQYKWFTQIGGFFLYLRRLAHKAATHGSDCFHSFRKKSMHVRYPGIRLSTSSFACYASYHCTPKSLVTKEQKYSLSIYYRRF
jgi:hypothetical protein